eukprot:2075356-Prymnesium_polylepis.1
MLTPWAILNGEAKALLFGTATSLKDWALLWFTAAYGGVRIYSQFFLLSQTYPPLHTRPAIGSVPHSRRVARSSLARPHPAGAGCAPFAHALAD